MYGYMGYALLNMLLSLIALKIFGKLYFEEFKLFNKIQKL